METVNENLSIANLADIKPSEIIEELLSRLKERERDIIIRRHGLRGTEKEILEGIGKAHNLTRERVRQIESVGLKKIREARQKEILVGIGKLIRELIESHGGIMEKEHLFEVLSHFGLNEASPADRAVFRNFYNFIILKILDGFSEVNKSDEFLSHVKLADKETGHLDELIRAIKKAVSEKGKILTTEELLSLAEEAARDCGITIVDSSDPNLNHYYEKRFSGEESGLLKEKKYLYSIIKAAKSLGQNVFGHWGLSGWPEIKPKNLNEKIYLVLKNTGKPLHFSDIAKKIDDVLFDRTPAAVRLPERQGREGKKTNVASAHNELILDEKFVLVGRGMYGLSEWGLKEGTVAEIITEIMKSVGSPLTREDVIERVLQERMVKKTTIALALSNKDKFAKNGNAFFIRADNVEAAG
ncbi:MAG: sigma factor-like helix-turn-helix DNA-binding protein [Patescibacteria group bacterium]